jgi:hypothetical protein
MINNGLQWRNPEWSSFPLALLDVVNVNLIGVWILLIYRYFQVPLHGPSRRASQRASFRVSTGSKDFSRTMFLAEKIPSGSSHMRLSSHNGRSKKQNQPSPNLSSPTPLSTNNAPSSNDGGGIDGEASETTFKDDENYFNIFDGSNPSGPWAEYIFDGDEIDEEEDQTETDRWKDAQDHV